MNERELVEAAVQGPLAPIADEVRQAVLPSLRLTRGDFAEATEDGSRIGGQPDLPRGTPWPDWRGRPLAFLAQIGLRDLPNISPGRDLLPPDGSLAFFFADDPEGQPWGFDPNDRGSGRVIYVPPDAGVERAALPEQLDTANSYFPGSLSAHVELTIAEPDALASPELAIGSELREAYLDLLEAFAATQGDEDAPRHRLLGHPDQVQGEMQTECQLVSHGLYLGDSSGSEDPRARHLRAGASEWKLVLQLESEFTPTEVMWGDAGRLYFWARESDLRARRFDATWTILQCG